MANKVEFGVSNMHHAKVTESGGAYTFGNYVADPGTTNIEWEPSGGQEVFHADNGSYYVTYTNNGGTITIEQALLSEQFLIDTGFYERDVNGAIVEVADKQPNPLAIAFDVDGDAKARHNVFYYCVPSIPGGSAATTEDTTTPSTSQIELTYTPIVMDGRKVSKLSLQLDPEHPTAYNDFFNAVYTPVWTETAQG
ncbi:major tail protein [Denitrobacterium detoxificans]|uniref:Phage major tail protein, phi13 family n=1 Tax=Denitrobacterium detoxificans TaxID=79604 RepID=A0A1H8UKT1_9ACTN|nr:major tail protein [Denitrobacterium detoxificans]SEP03696.1 phage major tail protein, phi13 family [Denitrobacterium detoxificans]